MQGQAGQKGVQAIKEKWRSIGNRTVARDKGSKSVIPATQWAMLLSVSLGGILDTQVSQRDKGDAKDDKGDYNNRIDRWVHR